MKNFDEEPDRGRDSGPDAPCVEIRGDLGAVSKQFQEKLATSISGDAARITEQFRLAAIHAPATEAVAKGIGESVKEMLAADREAHKDAIMKSLRAVDVPRIDIGKQVTALTRGKPLELPKPVRPIMDIRLEQLVGAVLALDEAMEARHVETESRAEARADRADARADRAELLARWGVTFAGLAAAGVVWEIFIR